MIGTEGSSRERSTGDDSSKRGGIPTPSGSGGRRSRAEERIPRSDSGESGPPLAYNDRVFLESDAGRPMRMLAANRGALEAGGRTIGLKDGRDPGPAGCGSGPVRPCLALPRARAGA
jgi:hypothetical protein